MSAIVPATGARAGEGDDAEPAAQGFLPSSCWIARVFCASAVTSFSSSWSYWSAGMLALRSLQSGDLIFELALLLERCAQRRIRDVRDCRLPGRGPTRDRASLPGRAAVLERRVLAQDIALALEGLLDLRAGVFESFLHRDPAVSIARRRLRQ